MHGININIIVGLYYMHVFLHRYVIPKEVLSQHHHPRRIGHPTTADIITATIKGIAPPHHPPDMPLSTLNNSAILDQLQCLICLEILCQPLELQCRELVCTTCMVRWFEVFSCSNVKCPCCFLDAPLLPSALKPAPPIIMALLQDIHVECSSCKKNIRIGDYNIHDCDVKPTKDEVKMASQVLSKLAATSPDKTISIPTDGLVSKTVLSYV